MFGEDDFSKHVFPTISKDGIDYVLASRVVVFESVQRYMWPSTSIDFELMSGIDYAHVVNETQLEDVICFLSTNRNRYPDEELLFLILRSMFSVIWKLDVLLLTHLEQCVMANYHWDYTLMSLSQNKLNGNYFALNSLPYWLRNTSVGYAKALPVELQDKYMQMEVVMVKANDIQAKCKLMGK